jgi:hypothetical protein
MKTLRRAFAALERRPWPLAVCAGLGFTLFVAGAVALFGSSELLDALVALGDAKLYGSLALLFVASACAARIAFRRRRRLEEDLDDIVLASASPKPATGRAVPADEPPADKPRKAYLR